MHRSRMSRQFSCLRDGVSHLLPRDANLGRAFALGLLSHYVLDRNAHPFVYEQQFGIVESDSELEDSSSQVHAVIESDLDVLMLQLKRDGGNGRGLSGRRARSLPPIASIALPVC